MTIGAEFARAQWATLQDQGLVPRGSVPQRKRARILKDRWQDFVLARLRNERITAKKVVNVTDTTRDLIRTTLAEGDEKGESILELSRRIDALYLDEIIPNRSEVIARTETISASNYGSFALAQESGLKLEKKWLATNDPRTRDEHAEAGRSSKWYPFDEPFEVGGEKLMFPGDSSHGASGWNTIQCRCTYITRPVKGADQPEQPATVAQPEVAPEPEPVLPSGADVRAKMQHDVDAWNRQGGYPMGTTVEALKEKFHKELTIPPAQRSAPYTIKHVGAAKKAEVKAQIKSGTDFLEKVVSKKFATQEATSKVVEVKAAGSRGYYNKDLLQVNMGAQDYGDTHKRDVIFVHEMGHHLEHWGDATLAARDFLMRRARQSGGLENIERMRDVTGNRGYRTDEVTWKDKFKDPYMGKVYTRAGVTAPKVSADLRATEIVSMGVEKLYKEPHQFMVDDPEYFDFIVDLIRGRFAPRIATT